MSQKWQIEKDLTSLKLGLHTTQGNLLFIIKIVLKYGEMNPILL